MISEIVPALVLVWVLLKQSLMESTWCVDLGHDPQTRDDGARRWSGGGKLNARCLRAVEVSRGSALPWGLA